jgi:hypothetical protein
MAGLPGYLESPEGARTMFQTASSLTSTSMGTGQRLSERFPLYPHNRREGPYAILIYYALMSRPNHAMTLQEIYQWFRENTGKTSNNSKGWQNSIRHNLSMNAVSQPPAKYAGRLFYIASSERSAAWPFAMARAACTSEPNIVTEMLTDTVHRPSRTVIQLDRKTRRDRPNGYLKTGPFTTVFRALRDTEREQTRADSLASDPSINLHGVDRAIPTPRTSRLGNRSTARPSLCHLPHTAPSPSLDLVSPAD